MHLGIDLGGTKTEIIALDKAYNTLLRDRIPSPQNSYQATLNMLVDLVQNTEQKLGQTGTLGIGIPGSLSPITGRIQNANSTWLINHDLKHDLEKALNRTVYIGNDADCFALSEACDGAAAGNKTVFGIIIGTGAGGGLVVNRQIICGPNAISGEWGHNPLPLMTQDDLPQTCYCGKRGCLETFISGPGLIRHFHLRFDSQQNIPDTRTLFDAFENKQTNAVKMVNKHLDWLSRGIAGIINIIDPDAIVLGGGLSNFEYLYSALPEKLEQWVFSEQCRTPILKAQHGDSSGVRGAAWLAIPEKQTGMTQ